VILTAAWTKPVAGPPRLPLTKPTAWPNIAAPGDAMVNGDPLDALKFDANGLLPLVVQDVENGQVLMVAYVNRAALEKTLETGLVHTYSRSRGRLALKGESSRHFQHVREIVTDCDGDAVLIKVVQDVAACHEGYRSCFFRRYDADAGQWRTTDAKRFDPEQVYSK
jgi:phosphoribosyl-AMP cyclohydrolase